jgi:hypothetical protein
LKESRKVAIVIPRAAAGEGGSTAADFVMSAVSFVLPTGVIWFLDILKSEDVLHTLSQQQNKVYILTIYICLDITSIVR